LRVRDSLRLHVEAHKESERIWLSVAWSQIAEDNVTGNLGILDVCRPAIAICLRVSESESSVCLITVWYDKTIGTVVGANSK
jgi:hypothetical protein